MSDEAEKAFEPTPQRIARAKREGNVARSGELSGNVAFAASAASVVAVVPVLAGLVRTALVEAPLHVPWRTCATVLMVGLVPVGCAALAGAIMAAIQNGGIAFVAAVPKFERLNPLDGCKRIFSCDTAAHGLRAVGAVVLAAAAIAPTIAACAVQLIAASLKAAVASAWHAVCQVAVSACIVGIIFAVAEYAFARRAWLRKLRMSFEERRREAKEQEGDPGERGRRRALHRSFLRGAVTAVKNASFVVANPTHIAVALQYRPPDVPVPRVLALAAGEAALRVRLLAVAYDIPVVENVWLARALYREGRVGEPIDAVHFVAVAEVVAALTRSKVLVS
jgi:flagellar biosynthesis protein FlhB